MPLDLTPKVMPYYDTATASGGIKQYIAKLSQLGTANPTVELIKNTYDETITWTRDSAGVYMSPVITGAFPTSKTTLQITPHIPANGVGMQNSNDQVAIYTGIPLQDEILDNTTVIITTHP